MVFIYALMSGQLVLYIGQTKDMKTRELYHRSKHNKCSSCDIPTYIDWQIKRIEECEADQRFIREQYWYDTLKPLYNKIRPAQTRKEYRVIHFDDRHDYYNQYKNTEAYIKHTQSDLRKTQKLAYSRTERAIQQRKEYRAKIKAKNNVSEH